MTYKHLGLSLASASLIGLLSACGGSDGTTTTVEPLTCGDTEATSVDEGNIGDFSNDPANPTPWTLGAGANTLRGSTSIPDNDYVAFTVGPCDTLDTITVTNFTSVGNDDRGFVALQQGSAFTVPEEEASTRIGQLFGYRHYGTADINQDILTEIGQGQGAIGFTAPLSAGTYTMWLNQTGDETQFTLVFNVNRVLPE